MNFKIGLVMFYDEKIKSYGDINLEINRKYCKRHNIDLIVSNTPVIPNRHPAWESLPLILKHLDNYDYIIYIDADAFFYYKDKNILELILQYKNYSIIFSEDFKYGYPLLKKYIKKPKMKPINTGVMIIKNDDYSTKFINKWLNDENYYKNNLFPSIWEQGVLWSLYNDNVLDIQNNSIIINYGIIQHLLRNDFIENTYIYHIAAKTERFRIRQSKKYLESIKG